jgi:PTH2 family peptidyl-tRNA hydrolase
MRSTKQVLVIRADLKMRRGKECAQASHASMKVFLDNKTKSSYGKDMDNLHVQLWPAAVSWLSNSFTKVCVRVDSEEELLDIFKKAQDAHIPSSLVTDSGKTEFHGVPTPTVVAIGPYYSEEIDKITGNLKLY